MLRPIRFILGVVAGALSVIGAAQAQSGTLGGVLGGVGSTVTTLLRETTLNLPAFRINALTGTQNFQVGVTYQGTTRVFYVIRPTTAVANAPVLFLLHGRGMTGDRMANYTAAAELTRDFGTWVVLPQAIGSEWASDPAGSSTTDDVGYLNSLISFVLANYPINPRRVYFAGLSSGGFMSIRMACNESDRIAAVFAVAASVRIAVRPECPSARAMPIGLINGTLDNIVPLRRLPGLRAEHAAEPDRCHRHRRLLGRSQRLHDDAGGNAGPAGRLERRHHRQPPPLSGLRRGSPGDPLHRHRRRPHLAGYPVRCLHHRSGADFAGHQCD